jgi:hypothetical protein
MLLNTTLAPPSCSWRRCDGDYNRRSPDWLKFKKSGGSCGEAGNGGGLRALIVGVNKPLHRALQHRIKRSLLTNNGSHWPCTDQLFWSKADLFFLADAVAHGMAFADVVGFLGRTEMQLREKSKYYLRARGARNGRAI